MPQVEDCKTLTALDTNFRVRIAVWTTQLMPQTKFRRNDFPSDEAECAHQRATTTADHADGHPVVAGTNSNEVVILRQSSAVNFTSLYSKVRLLVHIRHYSGNKENGQTRQTAKNI